MRFNNNPMSPLERRAVGGLAGIFALRMLGLFLILPVFAIYAENLRGHTPLLVGLALGVYGLTQALLQIPLGLLSDRIGRKPVITAGLLVFALGSVVAALSDSIVGVILGRALQGAGAIAAAVLALAADLTRDEQRTKAMALIGISIGAAFIISMAGGPLLGKSIGVPGIFWLTAVLALGGLGVLWWAVPNPVTGRASAPTLVPAQFAQVLRDGRLMRLNIGIFMLHAVLMAMFVVIPLALLKHAGLASELHWRIYIPVMLLAVLGMLPLIILSESKNRMRWVFSGAIALLLVAQGLLYLEHSSLTGLALGLLVFFVGFNFLEASLPSLISRAAPAASKGTAIGVYTTFEFLGAFAGGLAGGWLSQHYGTTTVFGLCAGLLLLWLVLALSAPEIRRLSTRTLNVGPQRPGQAKAMAQRFSAIAGVTEAVVMPEQGVVYLKVDDSRLDRDALERLIAPAEPL